jgi:signal transduction histidine kinase
MADSHPKRRHSIRREEDRQLRRELNRNNQLFQVAQRITSEINMDVLFKVIVEETNRIMGTKMCSVFLVDEDEQDLCSLVSTDLGRKEIRIPKDHGVAGWVFCNQTPALINDAYQDPRFYPGVDAETGVRTQNILCIPLISRRRKCIGTLQAMNKKGRDFTPKDRELLFKLGNYVTVALENAKLYEDLKALDQAKEKVINHLSHELKTPLAILKMVMTRLSRLPLLADHAKVQKTLQRGHRSVSRLLELEEKVSDILNQRSVEEKEQIINILEESLSFAEEMAEEDPALHQAILDKVIARLESIYQLETFNPQPISLENFIKSICEQAATADQNRHVDILSHVSTNLVLTMDQQVLTKVCGGLLKNAVENTPDQGRIEIEARQRDGAIQIVVQDFGVGITASNQHNIFGGFIHTQDTQLYSSKTPYAFNAGGTGSDLLRMKVFAERYGFSIDFESRRCRYIPLDTDHCPGDISECTFVNSPEGCYESGGSVFTVTFPIKT